MIAHTSVPILETGRLRLRPLALTDAPAIQRDFPHWEIVQFLGAKVPWPYPPDGAETNLRAALAQAPQPGVFAWALTLKEAGDDLIGRIDLRPFDEKERSQRGFWLARRFWGQGLITEAADAVVEFAFDTLGWTELWAANARANTSSSRVKARQGFELMEIDDYDFVSGRQPREVWRLERARWRALRTAPAAPPQQT